MKISAIISDIDGTFVDHQGQIPAGVADYYRELREVMKIPVHFATGRPYQSCKKRLDELGLLDQMDLCPGVYNDGGLVLGPKGEEDIVHEEMLDWEITEDVEKFLRELRVSRRLDLQLIWGSRAMFYAEKHDGHIVELNKVYDMEFEIVGMNRSWEDIEKKSASNLISVSVTCDPSIQGEIVEAVKSYLNGRARIMITEPWIFHIFHNQQSKGNGVKILCEKMGYANNEVIVLGDNINDIEMFNMFRYSVAMGNAIRLCKEAAYYEGLSVEKSGWKHSIAHILALSGPAAEVSTSDSTTAE